MCGICGWQQSKNQRLGKDDLERMVKALQHRGPDDSGMFQDPSQGIALGHNRLSILDLSEHGHQPMCNEETGDQLVFNGEIYNYRELRLQLTNSGYKFRSSSDTEVLLYCFAKWGIECLSKLKGMFAFALWEPASGTLHLVRDPLGIKPLYYWRLPGSGGLVFASELKAFLSLNGFQSIINNNSLGQFLEFGYTFDISDTIFKDVAKLPPGHRMELQNGCKGEPERYFFPVKKMFRGGESLDIKKQLYSTLSQVVGEHLVADVPVGLLLSGGLDSSILASIASRLGPIHTFSFGFAGSAVDERPYARRVSEFIGSQHEEILIQPAELLEDLEQAVFFFDDLFADWGLITTRLLYRKCREKGIKVVIVGEGSDELFGGYDIFCNAFPKYDRQPVEWRLFQLYRAYAGRRYGRQYFAFRARMREYLRQTDNDFFSAVRLFETRDQLPNNYVMKVDKASMSAGVEARVPFLDTRVAEIACRIPGKMLLNSRAEKIVLRQMAKKYDLLPDEIIQRKKFGASIAVNWMDDSRQFREFARAMILEQGEWVDELDLRDAMQSYFDRGRQGYRFPRAISIFRNLAWRLLILELWSKSYHSEINHA